MTRNLELSAPSNPLHLVHKEPAATAGSVAELRNLLAWGCRGDIALASAIKQHGWNLVVADDFGHARDLIDRRICRVGLVALQEHAADTGELERLLALDYAMLWVALLPDAGPLPPDVEILVSRYCYDYHTRPVDPERLLQTVGHAYGMSRLYAKLTVGPTIAQGDTSSVYASAAMRQVVRDVQKLARTDVPVLLQGETGTGKEYIAGAVHRLSARASGPFVAVNCAALPASLIQAELFGHERGAFTGATERRVGRLESAEGGTIFLDEIGDIPLDLQTNLLRFLEAKTIERVGGNREIPVNARVIAATHVDLAAAVARGTFREDLFYRLNVLGIAIPSLRERPEDIEPLARHFFERFAGERPTPIRDFSHEALLVMQRYGWPGNVRELMNRVRRAVVMAEGDLLHPRDLGLERRSAERDLTTLDDARTSAERRAVAAALLRARNNLSLASRELGISRSTLYRLVQRFGLASDEQTPAD